MKQEFTVSALQRQRRRYRGSAGISQMLRSKNWRMREMAESPDYRHVPTGRGPSGCPILKLYDRSVLADAQGLNSDRQIDRTVSLLRYGSLDQRVPRRSFGQGRFGSSRRGLGSSASSSWSTIHLG